MLRAKDLSSKMCESQLAVCWMLTAEIGRQQQCQDQSDEDLQADENRWPDDRVPSGD